MAAGDIENIICDTIQMYTDKLQRNIQRDKTITGEVIGYVDVVSKSPVDVITGYYKVKYQDTYLFCWTADPQIAYRLHDRVVVLISNGDFNSTKIIVGRNGYSANAVPVDYCRKDEVYTKQQIDDLIYKLKLELKGGASQ